MSEAARASGHARNLVVVAALARLAGAGCIGPRPVVTEAKLGGRTTTGVGLTM
jgi:hypothetical protein